MVALTISDEITQIGFFKTVEEPFIEEMAYGFNGTILVTEERFTGDDYLLNIYLIGFMHMPIPCMGYRNDQQKPCNLIVAKQ